MDIQFRISVVGDSVMINEPELVRQINDYLETQFDTPVSSLEMDLSQYYFIEIGDGKFRALVVSGEFIKKDVPVADDPGGELIAKLEGWNVVKLLKKVPDGEELVITRKGPAGTRPRSFYNNSEA
jgi:hypothetical protein